MDESQAFRGAAGLHSAAAPYWAVPLRIETGLDWLPVRAISPKMAPSLSAMWIPAAFTCCYSSISQWLTDRVSSPDRSESLKRTCVPRPESVCRFNPSRSLLLREDHEAGGQIQPADCWGKWESAQWLSFMISVGVIPPQNERLCTRQWSSWSVELSWIDKCRASTICTQRKPSVLLFISTTFDPVAANASVLLGLCCSATVLHCTVKSFSTFK